MTRQSAHTDVILGLSHRLHWDTLFPFIRSLHRTTFSGELHLFVGGTDAGTNEALRRAGAFVHAYHRLRFERRGHVFHPYELPLRRFRLSRVTARYPAAIRTLTAYSREPLVARAKLAAKISIPYVARFFRFFEFLASAPIAYRNVMLTDVRDVFFQRDPFDFDIGNRVNCFLEDERQTLGSERHNRAWLTTAYGEEVARSLADKPISCSGVTIGSRDAVFEYLRVLVGELLELRTQSVGIDQGVHNYVLHRELVPRSALLRNWDGPVLTLALVPPAEVEAAARNGRLNANVLHQYNHHPQLSARLLHELVA